MRCVEHQSILRCPLSLLGASVWSEGKLLGSGHSLQKGTGLLITWLARQNNG